MFISDHNNVGPSDINEDNLVRVRDCGICGNGQLKKLMKYSVKPNIYFVKCTGCGAVTYNRILDQKYIDNLYSSDEQYYKDDTSNESGGNITFYGSERFAKHLLKSYENIKKDNYRILDFGGGDGELAYAVAKQLYKKYRYKKAEITVVDYTCQLYKSRSKRVIMRHAFSLNELEQISDEDKVNNVDARGYDIIIASGVIEHIPRPGADIKLLFELLDSEGIIYFRTPYIYPLRRELQRIGIEYDTLFPAHIWDLGGKSGGVDCRNMLDVKIILD